MDGTIYICLELDYPGLYYFKSTNDGLTWSSLILFPENGYFLTINSINQNKIIALLETGTSSNKDIFYTTSTDNGITWSSNQPLVNSNLSEEKPMFFKTKDGRIFVFYNVSKPTPFSNIKQYDIHYSVSDDEGSTWTHHQFTRYVGDDQIVSITDSGNTPLVLILTKRFSPILKNQLGIGVVGLVNDLIAPPVIFKTEIIKSMPKDPIYVKSYVYDDDKINSVKLLLDRDEDTMYDDGQHNDENPNDYIFGTSFYSPVKEYENMLEIGSIKVNISNDGKISNVLSTLKIPIQIYTIDNHNLQFVHSDTIIFSSVGSSFDGIGLIFSGGFGLSGFNNDSLWANAVMTTFLIDDYVPGNVESNPSDPRNRIYRVRRSDPHFSKSWQEWKDAVSQGAYFYDGNKDGIYNPIDLNNQWSLGP